MENKWDSTQLTQDLELSPTGEEQRHWAAVDCVFEIILKAEYPKVWAFVVTEEHNQLSWINPYLNWNTIQRSNHLEREKLLDRMGYEKLVKKIEKALPKEIYNKERMEN